MTFNEMKYQQRIAICSKGNPKQVYLVHPQITWDFHAMRSWNMMTALALFLFVHSMDWHS